MVYDGTYMWATDWSSCYTRIASNGSTSTYAAGTTGGGAARYPLGMVYDGSYVWAANSGTGGFTRISSGGGLTHYDYVIPPLYALCLNGISLRGTCLLLIGVNNKIWMSNKAGTWYHCFTLPSITARNGVVAGCRLVVAGSTGDCLSAIGIDFASD